MIWKREDKENIVLRDGTGGVHRGNNTILYSGTVQVEFIEVIYYNIILRDGTVGVNRGNTTILYSETVGQVEFIEVIIQYCTQRRFR